MYIRKPSTAKMIDTVRFECDRPFKNEVRNAIANKDWHSSIAPGWKPPKASVQLIDGVKGEQKIGISTQHKDHGMRIWGDSRGIKVVEVSLPRLLHGSNGLPIKSQDELDEAWNKANTILDQISIPCSEFKGIRRVDLAWNFHCDPQLIFTLLEYSSWPRIRKGPEVYYEFTNKQTRVTGVRFAGKEISLTFYDKKAELRASGEGSPGSSRSLRVELQLKSRRVIHRALRDPQLHDDLQDETYWIPLHSFQRLYSILRTAILLIVPQELAIPAGRDDRYMLLAENEILRDIIKKNDLQEEIPSALRVAPLDRLAVTGHRPETSKKKRREINRRKSNIQALHIVVSV